MFWLDRLVAGMLAPLAMWVLASGLDDLFLDLCSIWFGIAGRRRQPAGTVPLPPAARENKIAVLIPAWREDAVIGQMLQRNLAAIQYANYEVFVGVYPNDLPTLSQVVACEAKDRRVHHVVCPHDGPTSKADCLNWIYQGVLALEETAASRFEIVAHHDAEDVIHPSSLSWINSYSELYDMIQVPVLPLPTGWREFTHGAYCDEFAQSHLKDLHVRRRLGGFLPSCGVGTAYRRCVLDRLAWSNGNQPFQPDSLTEDYQVGLALHRLGCRQILLDAQRLGQNGDPAATREYFPRRFRAAVRQKARWVAGITLQSWQGIGWNAGPGQWYWLWRDRKGLVGHPVTVLANLVFLYGLFGWAEALPAGSPWGLGEVISASRLLQWLLLINTALILIGQVSRAWCAATVYGWRHASLSPLRSAWGNVINFAATVRAIGLFAGAQLRRQPPAWLKTEHRYPKAEALIQAGWKGHEEPAVLPPSTKMT